MLISSPSSTSSSSSCPMTGCDHRVAALLITSSDTSICLGRYSFTRSESWAKYTWRRPSLSRSDHSRHPPTWRLAWVRDTWPLTPSKGSLRPGCWHPPISNEMKMLIYTSSVPWTRARSSSEELNSGYHWCTKIEIPTPWFEPASAQRQSSSSYMTMRTK